MSYDKKDHILYNLKLLYVEDEEITRKEMGKFLKRRIGKVYLAENGRDGLNLYKEHIPDIIIVDLIMPVMGGMEMIQHIRKMDSECAIIVISALGDVDSILGTVDVGINKYMIKPVNTDELLDALEEIAIKIFKRKRKLVLMDGSKKKEIEDKIKREFSYFIKKNTGKGPKEVNVFIQGNIVEISAHNVLTIFEKSLLNPKSNNVLVDQNRKLFYAIQSNHIESFISEIVESKVHINNIIVNSLRNTDKIVMSIL